MCHSIALLCAVLNVSRSAFYDWLKRAVSIREQEDDNLVVKIKVSCDNSRNSYRARRIKDDLLTAISYFDNDRSTPTVNLAFSKKYEQDIS